MAQNEKCGGMEQMFKLPVSVRIDIYHAGYHVLCRRSPLQRLNAGLLVCRNQMRAGIMKIRGI